MLLATSESLSPTFVFPTGYAVTAQQLLMSPAVVPQPPAASMLYDALHALGHKYEIRAPLTSAQLLQQYQEVAHDNGAPAATTEADADWLPSSDSPLDGHPVPANFSTTHAAAVTEVEGHPPLDDHRQAEMEHVGDEGVENYGGEFPYDKALPPTLAAGQEGLHSNVAGGQEAAATAAAQGVLLPTWAIGGGMAGAQGGAPLKGLPIPGAAGCLGGAQVCSLPTGGSGGGWEHPCGAVAGELAAFRGQQCVDLLACLSEGAAGSRVERSVQRRPPSPHDSSDARSSDVSDDEEDMPGSGGHKGSRVEKGGASTSEPGDTSTEEEGDKSPGFNSLAAETSDTALVALFSGASPFDPPAMGVGVGVSAGSPVAPHPDAGLAAIATAPSARRLVVRRSVPARKPTSPPPAALPAWQPPAPPDYSPESPQWPTMTSFLPWPLSSVSAANAIASAAPSPPPEDPEQRPAAFLFPEYFGSHAGGVGAAAAEPFGSSADAALDPHFPHFPLGCTPPLAAAPILCPAPVSSVASSAAAAASSWLGPRVVSASWEEEEDVPYGYLFD